ncbi:MAG: tRNA (N6-threonylcarbamoyladenosine(37)-N6)-methyltransferase TrmO [Thermoplasmata archaeon]|nr:tRNA (N6-threonylcarbamoyladenosine(37)-N6)-methyltransferase TrmO [Thermoplasmata archaeon]
MKNHYNLKPIGIVHSSFTTRKEVLNSKTAENLGELEIFQEYEEGLTDLEGFSHIIVLFWLHKASFKSLKVRPIYSPEKLRGLFATRHPDRPNPIGITIVELMERNGNVLKVKGIDMFDGTPILDIKPYLARDQKGDAKFGWLTGKKI